MSQPSQNSMETADARRARLLRAVAWVATYTALAGGGILLIEPIFAPVTLVWYNIAVLVQVVICAQYVLHLTRRGRSAATVFLASAFIAAAGSNWSAGLSSPNAVFYVSLVLATLLLLDISGALAMLGVCLLNFSAIFVVENVLNVYVPPGRIDLADRPLDSYLTLLLGICTAGGIAIYLHADARRSNATAIAQTNQLAAANTMLDRRNATGQEASQQVLSLTSELSAAATQHAAGAQNQLAAVTEMSAALTELAQAARHIAERAQDVDGVAGQARSLAETMRHVTVRAAGAGQRSVEAFNTILDGSGRLEQTYQQLTRTLLGLAERSRQVRNVLTLIEGIADETHMLALNAAIEAAGSSEHGARFGVIATQVKALADRSLNATNDVQTIITNIENAIGAAVMVAESGAVEVGRAVRVARDSSTIMADLAQTISQAEADAAQIVAVTANVRTLAREIAAATGQQQRADVQVLESLTDVRVIAEQSASSSRVLQSATASLEQLSRDLTTKLTV